MVLTHLQLDSSIIKLLGTEFIISHTFHSERYFSFTCMSCMENLIKYNKADFAGHCSNLNRKISRKSVCNFYWVKLGNER